MISLINLQFLGTSSHCFLNLLEFINHLLSLIFHKRRVCLNINRQVLHLLGLTFHLMNHAVDFETVDGEQTEAVAEDIHVVLIIDLRLIEQLKLQLLLAFIRWTFHSLLENILELIIVFLVAFFVFRVEDQIIILKIKRINIRLILRRLILPGHLALIFQVLLLELCDQIFEFICVLIDMQILGILYAKLLCKLP